MNLPFFSAAKQLLWVSVLSGSLGAATVTYTVANYTLSGGDPTYPVATDLTLNNLVLNEVFADASTRAVPLFDFSNTARTSLSTSTFSLSSSALNTLDPAHGAIVSATLTGSFSQTALSIVTSFGGTPVNVTVLPTFTATLPFSSSEIKLNAFTANGASYAVGALDESVTGAPAVPEPATFGAVCLGLTGLLAGFRRFRSRNA